MQRLAIKNLNTAEEYNKIFWQRKEKGIDKFDLRRWKRLLKHYKGGDLIDLGCLDSLVPYLAYKKYPAAEIWAIDQAEDVIAEMKKQFPDIRYATGNVYSLWFDDNDFAYVVLGEVLEHLEQPDLAIKEAFRILKKDGVLAISVPLNEAIEPGAVDADRHLWSYSLEDIKELVKGLGEVFDSEILRSIKKPIYKYCWPQLLVWVRKM